MKVEKQEVDHVLAFLSEFWMRLKREVKKAPKNLVYWATLNSAKYQ